MPHSLNTGELSQLQIPRALNPLLSQSPGGPESLRCFNFLGDFLRPVVPGLKTVVFQPQTSVTCVLTCLPPSPKDSEKIGQRWGEASVLIPRCF